MSTRKSLKDNLFRAVLSGLTLKAGSEQGSADDDNGGSTQNTSRLDLRTAKDLISAIAGWAGKGKDEIVQILSREIGLAIAGVVREPLTQILENRKLRVTLEFLPKSESSEKSKHGSTGRHRSKSKRSTKRTS